jgi:predicted ribosome quality control (RQC) complex YloA/Tae2 family protein
MPRRPWIRYILPGGWEVMAGLTDADNDRLSLREARPNDFWFHVRGQPGSHVVLRVPGDDPGRDTLRLAAAVAAYHSKARNAGEASNVSKPRGAAPGSVSIRRESVFKVRPSIEKAVVDRGDTLS